MRVLSADWHATAADRGGFPEPTLPEIAFLGRSNVGKSSLINALVGRKQLARTSSSPGKTRLIHWYAVRTDERELFLVDLPGYGYARVAKRERAAWQQLVESYLEARATLTAAVLLQDLRRDFSDDETLLVEWLAERDIPVVVAITKADKLKPMRRAARLRELRAAIALPAERVVATSAAHKSGLPDLWRAVT